MNELILVEKPGRYVPYETNIYAKEWDANDIRWVLVFPDVYEVGLSHLGLRILYHKLNRMEKVLADRAYTPWPDRERQLKNGQKTLCSHELNRPIKDFHFVGFSLQYELSYTNILTVLDLANISLHSKDRKAADPFVVGGGPCAFHAEPMADFFDFFILGEAEEVLEEIHEVFKEWRKNSTSRDSFLSEIRKIPGVYIPSFFEIKYKPNGEISSIIPKYTDYHTVKKRIIKSLDETSPFFPNDIVPVLGIVHDRLNVEIARGCTQGCRFCQAGFIYRPVREVEPKKVLDYIKEGLKKTGYEELSLLSLSTGDYSAIQWLLSKIVSEVSESKTAISLPSLRVGTLTESMIEAIKSIRKTGFTLAPEAGSERLRGVINKKISTEELLKTADYIYRSGWKLLKLYFMIGLPTEQDEDIEELINLCMEIWKLGKTAKGRLHVSVSTFVPKPHTPFQWCGQASRNYIEERLTYLKERFRRFKSIGLKWHNPGQSFWEAVTARGDRKLGKLILTAWQKGARLDGWTELFKEDLWHKAADETGLDPSFYANRTIELDEILPWDHLSCGVNKNYLLLEYKKALKCKFTDDCRHASCTGCGVCDFKTIQPIIYAAKKPTHRNKINIISEKHTEKKEYWYEFIYTKLGMAKFFSQIDIQKLLARAARRAGLPLVYSKGFHPAPRMSFQDALPLGVESLYEVGWIALTEKIDNFQSRWNEELPEGIKIIRVKIIDKKPAISTPHYYSYIIENLTEEEISILQNFVEKASKVVTVCKKGKTIQIPIKNTLEDFKIINSQGIEISIRHGNFPMVRPMDFLLSSGITRKRVSHIKIRKISAGVEECIVN